jgi:hypothetical protein
MERPTCKTCPYFDSYDDTKSSGYCMRNAPSPLSYPEFGRIEELPTNSRILWPEITEPGEDFCGEHPDFPAYLQVCEAASQEPQR